MDPARNIATTHRLSWSGKSDVGKVRQNNEDAFIGLQFDSREIHHLGRFGRAATDSTDFAFAVSDGMGGARAGEYASRIAVEKLTTLLPRAFRQTAVGLEAGILEILAEVFGEVHKALTHVGNSYDECRGMETTLSLCWFTPGWMYFGHIGDSRIYYLKNGETSLKQLSQDHTYVGWLFRNGQINEREARSHPRRNVLQQSLGAGNQFVDPQVGRVGCEPGDLFLLCSDGLVDGLYDSQILELLRPATAAGVDDHLAERLVNASLEVAGRDNTTALVIQVG